jgi:N-acetyl-anhydromuramyl-L-alanine amidase AmpD
MTAAEYPGAKWVPADSSNYRKAGRAHPSMIVIHCTDGREHAEPVAAMWQQPRHGSSAHFVIGQDGTVIQSVPIGDVAWHAHEANAYSIGIEHSCRTPRELGPSDPGLPPSPALYGASAQLVAWLCAHYGIQPSRVAILGHAEADHTTSHRLCPTGPGWDWSTYMQLVSAAYVQLVPAV